MTESESGPLRRTFFDDGSPYLNHPLLTEERTLRELAAIEELIGPLRGPVLDIGCGFGRHSVALADRGLEVVGIDPSATMIAAAQRRAAERGIEVDFVVQSAHEVDQEDRFATAICLFTSFGQRNPFSTTPTGASTRGLLAAMKRSMKDGAPLVIEVPELARSRELLAREEQLGPTSVTRMIDEDGLVSEVFDGPDGVFHLGYQAFRADYLKGLLEDRGFVVETMLDRGLVEPPGHLQTVVARNSG